MITYKERSRLFLLALSAFLPVGVVPLSAVETARPGKPVEGPVVSQNAVRLNSIGFPCGAAKRATVLGSVGAFSVVRVQDGVVVYRGRAGAPLQTPKAETDELVSVLDFSVVRMPGRYFLDVEGVGRSCEFPVGDDVWNRAFAVGTRAFYFWRCGTEVDGMHEGVRFHQAPCHLEDGWLDKFNGEHKRIDVSGGWHDAGDYNKYVVNAGVTTGLMFKAWEQFRGRVAAMRTDIPESGNEVPDLIDELRWEFEWLLKMQLEDGRVLHKVSSLDFRYWGPAERDKDPRYLSGWSSTATADFVAMMALGARHFREFDAAFADRCLAAAKRSYAYLRAHPENVAPEMSAFKTGGYDVKDGQHRLWAAIEMYETTGEQQALEDFEMKAEQGAFTYGGPNWGDVKDLAFGTYLLSTRPEARKAQLVENLRNNLMEIAERIVAVAETNAYGRPYGATRNTWYWGCNGTVAAQTYLLHVADRLQSNPQYKQAALHALGHLFGRNYYGRSFVSGLGHQPPQHMHDRRGEPAWPGYLTGGGWPDGRGWRDELASYKTNELAINWNASLVYAIAPFVQALEVEWEGRVMGEGEVLRTETSPALLNYRVSNKGTAPLRIDRVLVEPASAEVAAETDLKDGTTIAPGASLIPNFKLKAPAGGQSWEVRISIFYNGDSRNPFVWTFRKK